VTVAFTLFGMTIGFKASIDHVQDLARADRIYVGSRFGGQLPYALNEQLARLPGVAHVATRGGVGGYFQTPRNNCPLL